MFLETPGWFLLFFQDCLRRQIPNTMLSWWWLSSWIYPPNSRFFQTAHITLVHGHSVSRTSWYSRLGIILPLSVDRMSILPHFLMNRIWQMCTCCSITQSCLTLCNPLDCSMPGFSVHHHLPELAQTQIHLVTDTTQPFHPVTLFFSCSQSLPA